MPGLVALPRDNTDPVLLTDWLELSAIAAEDGNAGYGDLQRSLAPFSLEGIDELCSRSQLEVRRRLKAAEEGYPFSYSGTSLQLKKDWRSFIPYVFCLLLSYCDDDVKKIGGLKHTAMFEHLSCLAAEKYLGGRALRFGSPRDTLPSGFVKAVQQICQEIGEWEYIKGTPRPYNKDGSLDVVAWKPFPDCQLGKLILFGHCASGQNWLEKISELGPSNFCTRWLGGEKSPIVKTFFIPHRLSQDEFNDRAIDAKLFFDRCRIACLAPNDEFTKLTDCNCTRWCETLLKKIIQ
jgi:hypothetical protein